MRGIFAFVLLALIAHGYTRSQQAAPSYGELAQKTVVPFYTSFVSGLVLFTNASMPGKVKSTRGPVADFRTIIDVFAYAYPITSGFESDDVENSTDVYFVLVNDLTLGHNLLGEYSDLGSVKYSQKDKDALLAKCLAWKATYLNDSQKYNFDSYVKNPSATQLFIRSKKSLSGHFWGNVPQEPLANLSGMQNIASLQDGQLTQIITRYTIFLNYTNIWNKKVHADFHNYRKDLRYTHQTYSRFRDIYTDASKAKKGLDLVSTTEHQLGPINNRIEEYFFYLQKGNKQKCAALKTQIQKLWTAEKTRLQQEGYLALLQQIQSELIPH